MSRINPLPCTNADRRKLMPKKPPKRGLAVGRKNYLFVGADAGGATAAVLYSLTQSCQRLGIEPFAYLRNVLMCLPTWPLERLDELLPDQWAARQQFPSWATGPPRTC